MIALFEVGSTCDNVKMSGVKAWQLSVRGQRARSVADLAPSPAGTRLRASRRISPERERRCASRRVVHQYWPTGPCIASLQHNGPTSRESLQR